MICKSMNKLGNQCIEGAANKERKKTTIELFKIVDFLCR